MTKRNYIGFWCLLVALGLNILLDPSWSAQDVGIRAIGALTGIGFLLAVWPAPPKAQEERDKP